MDLQIVEINRINKIILGKPCLVVSFEFLDGCIQPDWFTQIEFVTYRVKRMEILCVRVSSVSSQTNGIPDHSVILELFSP